MPNVSASPSGKILLRQETEFVKKSAGSVNPESRKEIGQSAEIKENLADNIYNNLPEFSQVGFQIIDRVVSKAFGEQK